MCVPAVFTYSDFGDSGGLPGKEHRIESARTRIKPRYDQVIGVDFIDLLGQQLPARTVGRDAYRPARLSSSDPLRMTYA
jgi:hypothetical protein